MQHAELARSRLLIQPSEWRPQLQQRPSNIYCATTSQPLRLAMRRNLRLFATDSMIGGLCISESV